MRSIASCIIMMEVAQDFVSLVVADMADFASFLVMDTMYAVQMGLCNRCRMLGT
jgi:hypothetical protein